MEDTFFDRRSGDGNPEKQGISGAAAFQCAFEERVDVRLQHERWESTRRAVTFPDVDSLGIERSPAPRRAR
jgi:hypothetical protein